MNTEDRIQRGQEPFKRNNEGDFDVAPCGVLLFACETLHPTGKPPPESPATIRACNLMVQRVAARAKRNGCPDTARWLDQLTAPTVQERIAAADQLVQWMTFSEFEATIRNTKS